MTTLFGSSRERLACEDLQDRNSNLGVKIYMSFLCAMVAWKDGTYRIRNLTALYSTLKAMENDVEFSEIHIFLKVNDANIRQIWYFL